MRLYTSYYAKVARASVDALLIQVSNTAPNWFDKRLVSLDINVCPDWEYINAFKNGEISYEAFCSEYRRVLTSKVQPEFILHEIKGLSQVYNKEAVILLCYEKDGNSCHRTELARLIDDGCYCGEL
jgi:uncharacterized protein YeaO (DUF488 family)